MLKRKEKKETMKSNHNNGSSGDQNCSNLYYDDRNRIQSKAAEQKMNRQEAKQKDAEKIMSKCQFVETKKKSELKKEGKGITNCYTFTVKFQI